MCLFSLLTWMITYNHFLFNKLMMVLFSVGFLLNLIGAKRAPEKLSISDFDDFRQLVYAMNSKIST